MIVRWLALLVMWVALQGELTVGNVVAGLLVVAALESVFPGDARPNHRLRPIGALRLASYVLVNLVTSSWAVVRTVLHPDADRVHTEVVVVTLTTRSPLVATLVANSMTLTPGTMTVDIVHADDRDTGALEVHVHVLGRVEHEAFVASVLALERKALGAVHVPAEGAT